MAKEKRKKWLRGVARLGGSGQGGGTQTSRKGRKQKKQPGGGCGPAPWKILQVATHCLGGATVRKKRIEVGKGFPRLVLAHGGGGEVWRTYAL